MKFKILIKNFFVLAMVVCLCACGKIEFSEKGKVAVDKVEELQNYMKAPDTFVLKDDVLVIEQDNKNSDQSNIFVYIVYTAENSYGVPLQDMAVFRNDEYLGSYDDIANDETTTDDLAKNSSTFEDYANSVVQYIIREDCLNLYSDWKNGKIEKYEIISCKNIGKELGINYK